MNKLSWAIVALLAAVSAPAQAQTAKFLKKHGDWSVYAHDEGGKKTCFIVAQPRDSKPKNVKRDPIYFYVSNWPADNVTGELSIKMGYPLKPGVPLQISIGDTKVEGFTKGEGGYVEKAADEAKVVEAMKKGSVMVIRGRSTRGTLTTDEYSLTGVTDALNGSAEACK